MVAGKGQGAPSEMSQNRLHLYGYFATGQFAQRLLADSDVPTVDMRYRQTGRS